MRTITFEQTLPYMHKWAGYFRNNRFEHWELINATWLYGKVRHWPQSKIRFASLRIKYDMMDYMRKVLDYRSCYKRQEKGLSFLPVSYFTEIIGKKREELIPFRDESANFLEIKEREELIDFMMRYIRTTRIEKLILNLYYKKNYSMKEIAKICGYHESRISQYHKDLIKRLRAVFCTEEGREVLLENYA